MKWLNNILRRDAPLSIENPAVPLSNKRVLAYFGLQDEGEVPAVNETTAMGLTSVWQAIQLLAGTLASLPFRVLRQTDDRRERVDPKHPVRQLLHRQPNELMTPQVFLEMLMGNVLLHGNGYALIGRDRRMRPVELLPVVATSCTPRKIGGAMALDVTVGGRMVTADPGDFIHIPGMVMDGVLGLRPIRHARRSLGVAVAAQEFAGRFYARGTTAGGILKHPGTMKPESADRLRDRWQEVYGGANNAFRTMVLEEGMDWQQTTNDAEKSQLLDTRQFSVVEVARIFSVPPHMLYDLSRATFSNIEHQSGEFVRYSLNRWMRRIEQELNRRLFTPAEQAAGYYVKMNPEALLRGDSKARSQFYREMTGIGVLSINEVRELEDMDPIGPEGDVHRIQLAMAPAAEVDEINSSGDDEDGAGPGEGDGEPGDPGDPNAGDSGGSEGGRRDAPGAPGVAAAWLSAEAGRVATRELDRLRRAAKRASSSEALEAQLGDLYDDHEAFAARSLAGPLAHLDIDAAAAARRVRISGESRLKAVLRAEGDWRAGVERRLAAWDTERADELARIIMEAEA
jgi:HK97 family phage portal protein